MVDRHTRQQRSWNMSRIRGMDTAPEMALRKCAYKRGMRFRKHVMSLPGRPDMVFSQSRVVVFIDGDFWHGWRFPQWCSRLSPFWKAKIERNRSRDLRNFGRLRRAGWKVVRIWEHQVSSDPEACVDRIEAAIRAHGGSALRASRAASAFRSCAANDSATSR
jgi:DNA mismatch endonuclease (patch repair protein)